MQLPDGYRGVVAAVTSAAEEQEQDQDQEHSRRRRREEEEAGGVEVIDLEAETPTGCVRVQAEFDQMVVWGHEATADAAADPYLRGVEEWLAVAEQVCSVVTSPFPGDDGWGWGWADVRRARGRFTRTPLRTPKRRRSDGAGGAGYSLHAGQDTMSARKATPLRIAAQGSLVILPRNAAILPTVPQ